MGNKVVNLCCNAAFCSYVQNVVHLLRTYQLVNHICILSHMNYKKI